MSAPTGGMMRRRDVEDAVPYERDDADGVPCGWASDALAVGLGQQVGQRDAVQIVVDEGIQLFPHG